MRPTPSPLNTRGLTLVELMIVVAIVGVLASIASFSFSKYVTASKVTEMKQWAMDIARGQEQYLSRNGQYLDLESKTYDRDLPEWTNLLEFNGNVPDHVTIYTHAGFGGTTCNLCAGIDPDVDKDEPWFAVRVVNTEIERDVLLMNDGTPPIELTVNYKSGE